MTKSEELIKDIRDNSSGCWGQHIRTEDAETLIKAALPGIQREAFEKGYKYGSNRPAYSTSNRYEEQEREFIDRKFAAYLEQEAEEQLPAERRGFRFWGGFPHKAEEVG